MNGQTQISMPKLSEPAATALPRVSVIVPARNAAQTLSETLASLCTQTLAAWEALVVDDRSTDATAQLAATESAADPRIRPLSAGQAGGSAGAVRNIGLTEARGEFVLFLDADDWIAPGHLAALVAALDADPAAGVAYCGWRRVFPDGVHGPDQWNPDVARDPALVFNRLCGTAIHSVLIRRDIVDRLGGFDTGLRTCEDWDLWRRIASMGTRFLPVPETLAFYRMRPGSLTHDTGQMVRDALVVLGRSQQGSYDGVGFDPAVASALFVLWCAALDVGAGGNGMAAFDAAEPLTDLSSVTTSVVGTMVDALCIGAGCITAEFVRRHATAWPRLERVLERAGGGREGLARFVAYGIGRYLLENADGPAMVQFGPVQSARMDIGRLVPVVAAPGADMLLLRLDRGDTVVLATTLPLLGDLAASDIAEVAIERLCLGPFLRSSGAPRRAAFWAGAVPAAALGTLRAVGSAGRDVLRGRSPAMPALKKVARRAARAGALAAAGRPADPNAALGTATLDAILAEAEALARAAGPVPEAKTAPLQLPGPPVWSPHDEDRSGFWEANFQTPDPWSYTSDDEKLKYERTLSLLPDAPIPQALELACAEGHFTRMLGPRVGRLLATDISETAVRRAAERCDGVGDIAFRQLDLIEHELPSGQDLIVCAEVLYYMKDAAQLSAVAARICDALKPGGVLLMAHAFEIGDDPSRTGFDWDQPFGAAVISRVFGATPGLQLEHSLETELYRIDRLRRVSDGTPAPEPVVEKVPLASPLVPAVARHVKWGGVEMRRQDALLTQTTTSVPVLMYHRVAEDGPASLARFRVAGAMFEEQMKLLRRRGYHPISSQELQWFIRNHHPIPGRPVLITFDDGYCDFATTAWPILEANNFTAEVFVCTDAIGGTSDWDAAYGPPAPLMDWPEIAALSRAGVRFGSHLTRHVAAETLSTRDLAQELARSRAMLSERLGTDVTSVAAPYGRLDERFTWLAAAFGYTAGFSTKPGRAPLGHWPLWLPRIEVRGDWSLAQFAAELEVGA
jgi:peptidoglycan/xylan/chitin deacetylase (PgdA/CDA1 family)